MYPRTRSDETVPAFATYMFSSRHTYGTCLCPDSTTCDPGLDQHLEQVAGVRHGAALAAGPGDRQQVVVQREDLQVGRRRELLA